MKICIVGGGTSAWLTAAFLNNNFQHDIIVIDSDKATSIGVGEATVINFVNYWVECGFTYQDLFTKIGATIKTGILFKNWQENNKDIWNPFYGPSRSLYENNLIVQHFAYKYEMWSKNKECCDIKYSIPNYDISVINNQIDLMIANKGWRFAFHVDCKKLVEFIQWKILNNINFINSAVKTVQRDSTTSNNITNLILDNGQQIQADLYIDCTGFKSVLKKQKKINLIDSRLFCNTAIASHVPYINFKKELRPYTICHAVEHGWIWRIPLLDRFGSGLVFNRNVTDPEKAKKYFINYWDYRIDESQVNVIDWTPYYIDNFWEDNVVSIGMSAGFIEPLESTGIQFIILGVQNLINVLTKNYYTNKNILSYNLEMIEHYNFFIDYINMHYTPLADTNAKKEGLFWEYVRENHVKSDKQLYFEEYMKNPHMIIGSELFADEELWLCIMSQLNLNFDIVKKETNQFALFNKNIHYYEHIEKNRYLMGIEYPEFIRQLSKAGNYYIPMAGDFI